MRQRLYTLAQALLFLLGCVLALDSTSPVKGRPLLMVAAGFACVAAGTVVLILIERFVMFLLAVWLTYSRSRPYATGGPRVLPLRSRQ